MKPPEAMPDAPTEVCPHCQGEIDITGHDGTYRLICQRRRIVLYIWSYPMTAWERVEKFEAVA